MRKGRPPKIEDLQRRIHEALDEGRFRDVVHARERQAERDITRPEYLYVLRNGYHEARKDEYKPEFCAWNYAVRGRTVDGRDLRVVVSFEEDGMLIITTIEVGR